jgi:hypothetical protein
LRRLVSGRIQAGRSHQPKVRTCLWPPRAAQAPR